MKKRKELNALVATGKARKKSGSSASSHELLGNDSDTTDTEEFSILQSRKSLTNGRAASRLCVACLPLCMLTLVVACIVGSAMLLWMHMGLREEVEMLRNYFKKVEAGSRQAPEEFHNIHNQLKTLESNTSVMWGSIVKIGADVAALTKAVEALKLTTDSLSKSIEAAPAIETLPKDVKLLQQSVAEMGSKITDAETSIKEIKEQATSSNKDIQSKMDTLQTKVQSMTSEVQATTISAVPFYTEDIQKVIEDLNRTLTLRIQSAEYDVSAQKALIQALRSSSNRTASLLDTLESKTTNNTKAFQRLQEIVYEEFNQTVCRGCLGNSSEQLFLHSNVTGDQMISYLKNLTKVYNALLLKFAEFEKENRYDLNQNLLNENTTLSMEKMITDSVKRVERNLTKHYGNVSQEITVIQNDVYSMKLQIGILETEQNVTTLELGRIKSTLTEVQTRRPPQSTAAESPKQGESTTASSEAVANEKKGASPKPIVSPG